MLLPPEYGRQITYCIFAGKWVRKKFAGFKKELKGLKVIKRTINLFTNSYHNIIIIYSIYRGFRKLLINDPTIAWPAAQTFNLSLTLHLLYIKLENFVSFRQVCRHCHNHTGATCHPSNHLRPQCQQEVVQWRWLARWRQEGRLHWHLLSAPQ